MHPRIGELLGKLRSTDRSRLILLSGIIGAVLLLLPGMLPHHSRQEPASLPSDGTVQAEQYRQQLEERLTALLSAMEGVGHAEVMITVSGTAEQVYAEEIKTSRGANGIRQESEPVMTRSGSSEAPLIARTVCPAVEGAAILCSGGDHAAVQERVSRAAAALLGIPQTRIFVGRSAASSKF
ncbi:MAG: hypothetical protein J5722_05725 [Oscillospiraceae bacterium]|nr:hypothetical protein [Oscillospiraceae bacterium]